MSVFDRALADTLLFEGGYVNDPTDPGGETNMGISRRSYPTEDIRGMTLARARLLYHRDFWRPLRCDEMPAPVAAKVFDVAVNMGKRRAALMLQSVLCDLGQSVAVDGKVGRQTLTALGRCVPEQVVGAICEMQRQHYETLVRSNPTLRRFAAGWARRAKHAPRLTA